MSFVMFICVCVLVIGIFKWILILINLRLIIIYWFISNEFDVYI